MVGFIEGMRSILAVVKSLSLQKSCILLISSKDYLCVPQGMEIHKCSTLEDEEREVIPENSLVL